MFGSFGLAFVVAIVCGPVILMSVVVGAQSTVGDTDSASCESSTLDEAVNRIRDELKEVKLIRADFSDVKSACVTNQQQSSAVDTSSLSANCIPLLIQQHIDGSDFFNRSWAEFKVGFNDSSGNYWLGNELLSQLTLNGRYKLRFDLQLSANSSWYYAEYSLFTVYGESRNYQLRVSGYSGNAGDAFSNHNEMMFTTYDRDNDVWVRSGNCAVVDGGGFWHRGCSRCSVNSIRGGRGDSFRWWSPQYGNLLLQTSRMWLMC